MRVYAECMCVGERVWVHFSAHIWGRLLMHGCVRRSHLCGLGVVYTMLSSSSQHQPLYTYICLRILWFGDVLGHYNAETLQTVHLFRLVRKLHQIGSTIFCLVIYFDVYGSFEAAYTLSVVVVHVCSMRGKYSIQHMNVHYIDLPDAVQWVLEWANVCLISWRSEWLMRNNVNEECSMYITYVVKQARTFL